MEKPIPVTVFKREKIMSKREEGVNRIVGKERAVACVGHGFFLNLISIDAVIICVIN